MPPKKTLGIKQLAAAVRADQERQKREAEAAAAEEARRLAEEREQAEQARIDALEAANARAAAEAEAAARAASAAKANKELERQHQIARLATSSTVSAAPVAETVAEPTSELVTVRSPICVVMGDVDAGKTTLLDKLFGTNVRRGESGGITQGIRAVYLPRDAMRSHGGRAPIGFPGMVMIDTPGHKSFSSLRLRGGASSDICILVVNIVKGVPATSVDIIEVLRTNKCPFIIALNQIDRSCDGWQTGVSPKNQAPHVYNAYETRLAHVKTQLQMLGFNSALYSENTEPGRVLSIVPIAAKFGDGIPELIDAIATITQRFMQKTLAITDAFECTVIDVYADAVCVILESGTIVHGQELMFQDVHGNMIKRRVMSISMNNTIVREITGTTCARLAIGSARDLLSGVPVRLPTAAGQSAMPVTATAPVAAAPAAVPMTANGIRVYADKESSLTGLVTELVGRGIPIAAAAVGVPKPVELTRYAEKMKNTRYGVLVFYMLPNIPTLIKNAQQSKLRAYGGTNLYAIADEIKAADDVFDKAEHEAFMRKVIFPVKLKITEILYGKGTTAPVLAVTVLAGHLVPRTPLCVLDSKTKAPMFIGVVSSLRVDDRDAQRADLGQNCSCGIEPIDSKARAGRAYDVGDVLYSCVTRESIMALHAVSKKPRIVSADDKAAANELSEIFGLHGPKF